MSYLTHPFFRLALNTQKFSTPKPYLPPQWLGGAGPGGVHVPVK